MEFLGNQIESQKAVLDEKETTLGKFKDAHRDELPEFLSQNVTRLSQMKVDISKKESELAGARETMASIARQLARNNPVVGHLEEQIVELRGELAILSARYTPKHSKVQGATRQLERLESERERLMSEIGNVADIERMLNTPMGPSGPSDARPTNTLLVSQLEKYSAAKTQVEGLERELERLQKAVAEAEVSSADVGALEQRIQDMERDIKVQRTLYEDMLSRLERARVTSSLGRFAQAERIKVIDPPYTPTASANLPIVAFVLGGIFAGIALGISLATVLELMDSSIRSRRALEAFTEDVLNRSIPMLTRIPPLTESAAHPAPGTPLLRPVPSPQRRASA